MCSWLGHDGNLRKCADRDERGSPEVPALRPVESHSSWDRPLESRTADNVPPSQSEDVTKRREAITGTTLAAVLPPAAFETVEWLEIGGSRRGVDEKLVAAHQEIAQVLAGLYRSADPRSVLLIMTAYADQLTDLLDSPMGDSDRAALNTIAVGGALLACATASAQAGQLCLRYVISMISYATCFFCEGSLLWTTFG